jgi:hypothetical protein
MTVVMKKAPPGHCSRCREDDVLLAIDSSNSRILHYLKTGNQKKLELPVVCVLILLLKRHRIFTCMNRLYFYHLKVASSNPVHD